MKRRILSIYLMSFLIILIVLAFIAIFIYLSITYISINPANQNISISSFLVTNVVDGDTFQLYNGETVRLICVDTPEANQSGYEEAKIFLESLILNKEVRLESDIEDRDQYNRLLRYAYIEENDQLIFVNKEIVKNNFGTLFPYGESTKRCGEISS